MAFDPLIGRPVPKSEYCSILFGEPLNMEVEYSANRTLREIKTSKEAA